jgi:hypothetical protein
LEDEIRKHRDATIKHIQDLVSLDLELWPFTLNEHYYVSLRENYLRQFKHAPGAQALCDRDYRSEQAIMVMAECEAYYRVAFKVPAYPSPSDKQSKTSVSENNRHYPPDD